MLERHGVIQGSVERGSVSVAGDLPGDLDDPEAYEAKILRDRKKLLGMVEYFNSAECRRVSIEQYFGFDDQKACGNCDRC